MSTRALLAREYKRVRTMPAAAPARPLRLHAFELLIFLVMFVLLGLCLTVAPLVAGPGSGKNAGSVYP